MVLVCGKIVNDLEISKTKKKKRKKEKKGERVTKVVGIFCILKGKEKVARQKQKS